MNGTSPAAASTSPETVFAAVLAGAASDPEAVALIGSVDRLTYRDLLGHLRFVGREVERATRPGDAVATLLRYTPAGVAALLGCVASGRVVIVLNPADPPERLKTLLADAAPACVVTDSVDVLGGVLPTAATLIALDSGGAWPVERDWCPAYVAGSDDPMIVHYTSGSTGRPKGIASSLRGIHFRWRSCVDGWLPTPADRVLCISQPTTSSSFCFILATLSAGAGLVVADLPRDGATRVLRLARDAGITLGIFNPAVLRALMRLPDADAAFSGLRLLRLGGGSLPFVDLDAWRARLPSGCTISHTYASTEGNVLAEWFLPPGYRTDEALLPIGHLHPGQIATIVDEAGTPVEDGETGELVVSSPYVAVGEWQDGRLAPGRMMPDPLRPGSRVFRTGDLVRRGPGGMLRFASRNDRQIKINGVRIEPASLEATLRAERFVTDAIVVPRDSGGQVALDAFVSAPGSDPVALRAKLLARLAALLPRSQRPLSLTILDVLPSLPGGKVDVAALRRAAEERTA